MRRPLTIANIPFPVDHRSEFIKQFDGPKEGSGIVCFKFWELVIASGCPFRCSYCFFQTLPSVRHKREALTGLLYSNWRQMLDEVEQWLLARTPRMLIAGELQDGLAFDSAYKKLTGKPLTHHLVPLFAGQRRHKLIFLTKSTLIRNALQLEPTPQVVFSWSINSQYVADRWEQGAPTPRGRFAAARCMKEAGWPIRFRLDPMIPYEDGKEHWRDGYARTIDQINALEPAMVTLGTLRATYKEALRKAAEKNGRPTDIFNFLTEKDPSGFKYRIPFEQQVEMYRFALDRLDCRAELALCKEDASVWQALKLPFRGCHCLLDGDVPAEIVSTDSFRRTLGATTAT
jgi:spore photoproduct lyase